MKMTEQPIQTATQQKEAWGQAITLWLASREAPSTRRAYGKALEDLLSSSGKVPWEINRTDVIRWVQVLKGRSLSPATIATRLAGVSSFYIFAMEDFIMTSPDGQQSYLSNINPAAGKSLRPRVEMYGKSIWLSAEEARSLLRAIGQKSIKAKRDYALFLGYILLARRNSEWRCARWGDFDKRGPGHIEFKWSGKGKTNQRMEVPAPVWMAVGDFLKSAKRQKTIKAEDYIFTPMKDRTPLPGGRVVDRNHPISSHEVGRLLKRYASIAGLEPEGIHPHILRHTGAMLRREVGSSPEQVQRFLGHAHLDTTAIYLHALEGKDDQSWAKVSTLLGLDL